MASKKKKFRIEGIPAGKSIAAFAKNIETTMNQIEADGYTAQLFERDNGMLVLGRANEQEDEPAIGVIPLPAALLAHMRNPLGRTLSARTTELFARFIKAANMTRDPDALEAATAKQVPQLIKDFTAEELSKAAMELSAEAVEHAKTHTDDGETCLMPKMLDVVARLIKASVQLQLQ